MNIIPETADERRRRLNCEKAARYRERNRGKVREGGRISKAKSRAADPERDRMSKRQHYVRHAEEVKAKTRANRAKTPLELQRFWSMRWQAANPERFLSNRRARNQRRRAIKAKAAGTFAARDIQTQFKVQKGLCFYCSANLGELKDGNFHVDHFIPLSRQGSNYPENLVCACEFCNLSKGAKLPWEWMPQRFSPPQAAD